MHVMHITRLTNIAGSERHLMSLLPGLVGAGFDVSCVMLEDPDRPVDGFATLMVENGVSVHRIPMRWHLDPTAWADLRDYIEEWQPQIVHTHLVHADFYGLLLGKSADTPLLISSRHNDDAFRNRRIFQIANRWLMARADAVLAISNAIGRFVVDVEGIEAKKVHVVHYGLDVPDHTNSREDARVALKIKSDGVVFGFVGRLIEQKGVDVLIEAFARASREKPGGMLSIIGDGPLMKDLKRLAVLRGVGPSVIFHGWMPDASTLMPAFDALMVPSRWEGFGLVTLEAMSHRVPVIASRVSALPEIVVDGVTGVLIPPDDPDLLAGAMITGLKDPALLESYGQAGYERLLNRFTVAAMVAETAGLYRKLAEINGVKG